MLNRWIGITSIAFMLSANSALFLRDIVPVWFAPDPPQPSSLCLATGDVLRVQVGIFNERGDRIGVSQTDARQIGVRISIDVTTVLNLEDLPIPEDVAATPLKIQTHLFYTRAGALDTFDGKVSAFGLTASLCGESYPGGDFVCQWQFGEQTGRFVIPIEATRALGDVIRPFETLPNLFVGRTWRVELFQPLTNLLSTTGRTTQMFDSVVVSVTAEEVIEHANERVTTFRIEGPRIRAWVTPVGRVLKQEVDVPVLGRLTLLDEPWDEAQSRRDALPRRAGMRDR